MVVSCVSAKLWLLCVVCFRSVRGKDMDAACLLVARCCCFCVCACVSL